MSRTYRKVVKRGLCCGSNTDFYRDMNRKCRNKNRHTLRNLVSNYDIDTVAEIIPAAEVPIHDSWNEPTDGTYIVTKMDKEFYTTDEYYSKKNIWNRKFGKYLKSKRTSNKQT